MRTKAAPTEAATDNGADPAGRPSIDAGNRDLASISGEAWAAVLTANTPPSLFRFGGLASRIESGDDRAPVIRILTEARLRYVLGRCAIWYVGDQVVLPPLHVVRDMLATSEPAAPDPPRRG